MEIRHDEDGSRFVLERDGKDATLAYTMRGDDAIHFTSTYVPPPIRNQGHGARLVKAGLEHARAQGYRVSTSCWFVEEFLDRNPEYQELLE